MADDIVIHSPAGHELDRERWLVDEKALWAAFEDIDVTVVDQVAEGDMVASRWSLSGRQTAEFLGVPSRGGIATLTGILFDRIRDDKIAEHWAEVGLSHFLQVLSDASPIAVAPTLILRSREMTSMKAVVVDRYGGPFRVAELPMPEATPGQILVRVEAAGLNPVDWQFADGALRELIPAVFPMVIGSDAAGEVAAVGESVSRFGVGDKVYGQFLGHPIGSTGTFAEFVAIDENASIGPSPTNWLEVVWRCSRLPAILSTSS